MLCFVGHMVSVITTQQCESSHRQRNVCGCVQIKLIYKTLLQNRPRGQLAGSCVRGSNSQIPRMSETEAE